MQWLVEAIDLNAQTGAPVIHPSYARREMEVGGVGWTATAPGEELWRVRICTRDGQVMGAGLVVCTGQVLTCAHVVEAAAGPAADGPSATVRVELVGLPDIPATTATVATGCWFPPQHDDRGDVALLDLAPAGTVPEPAPLRRLPATRDRRVRTFGYPTGAERPGISARATLAGAGAGGEWVQMDATGAGPGIGRGFSGAAVVDEDTGYVIGMVVTTFAGAAVSWMLPVETILRYVPLQECVDGQAAVDGTLVGHSDAAIDVGVARHVSSWLAGNSRRRVLLVMTGATDSGIAAELRRLVVLADRELRPPADDRSIVAAPDGTVPPVGSVELAVDASHRSVDEVSRRIGDRVGITFDELPDAVRRVRALAPEMTLVIDGVDDAAQPEALIEDLLAPLAERGVRLLLSFRRPSSPAWRLAQARWPDHDRHEDDPLVVRRRLDILGARITDVATHEDGLLRRRANVAMRIAAVPELPGRAMSLRLRLTALRKAATDRDWSWLLPQLDSCEAAVDRAFTRMADFESLLDGVLDRRAELRGRLDAHHARARAAGHIEDQVLDRLYRQAHDALWRAPCDLSFAADLVAHYERAVRERDPGPAGGDAGAGDDGAADP